MDSAKLREILQNLVRAIEREGIDYNVLGTFDFGRLSDAKNQACFFHD